MKRLLSLLLFVALPAFGEVLPIREFAGINKDDSPLTLKNGQTPDSQNVRTDEPGGGIQGRLGFVEFSTVTAKAMWQFSHSNGTKYLIVHSGDSLLADTGSGAFETTVSTVAADLVTVGTSLGDKFFFSNTTDGLKYWDTSSVTVADADMKFTTMVTHKGRIWGAGVPSSERTIYASAFNDGTDFTLVADPADDDPAQFVVGGSNDEVVSAIYASFRDSLMWFKSRSFGSILGTDRADFEVRTYSDEVGTAYKDSVQDCAGFLRFLGPLRTIWEWNGSNLLKISEDIDGLLATVSQGDANARNYTFTTQDDYNSGTRHQTTEIITSGDVMLSTWTATDTTTADFNSGATSNTSVISNRVYLSTNTNLVTNNSFESDFTGWEQLTGSFSTTCVGSGAIDGTKCATIGLAGTPPTQLTLQILDSANNVLETETFNISSAYAQFTHTISSAYVGRFIKLRFSIPAGSFRSQNAFLYSGAGSVSFYAAASSSANQASIDNITGNIMSTIFSGTFTSQSFDTALTSAAWRASDATWTTNGHSVTMQTQSSSDGSSWQSAVSWSTGSAPTSDFRRYIRYVVTLSTGGTTDGTALPYVDDVTLTARANTGSWISPAIDLGSISAFSTFGVDTELNSGTAVYAIYTDTDTAMTITNGVPVSGTYTSSETLTNGAIPTLSTAAYARLGETFTITVATYNPTNHSLSLNWNEGSILVVPSGFPSQRYWLSVAINSATNNRVLVYDRKRQWQLDVGQNIDAMTVYNGFHYFGNSSGIFKAESGYDDDDSDIAAYYKTATFAPSGLNLYSTFHDLWMTMDRSASTLVTAYQVDGINTDYNLGGASGFAMNVQSGSQNRKLPFPFSQIQQGKYINFKWSVTGTAFWRILGADLEFYPDRYPMGG